MNSALFGTVLLIGTAAIGQGTTAGIEIRTTAPTGATVAPGNTAPERDARGIAVISAPAIAPGGWNEPPGQAGAPASANRREIVADDQLRPVHRRSDAAAPALPCSRTVTDRCVQTYERGVGRGR